MQLAAMASGDAFQLDGAPERRLAYDGRPYTNRWNEDAEERQLNGQTLGGRQLNAAAIFAMENRRTTTLVLTALIAWSKQALGIQRRVAL